MHALLVLDPRTALFVGGGKPTTKEKGKEQAQENKGRIGEKENEECRQPEWQPSV